MDELRETTSEHLDAIAANARKADVFECYFLNGKPFNETLQDALRVSRSTTTWMHNGKPAAVYGVSLIKGEKASPWLLGSKLMDSFLEPGSIRNHTRFMKQSRWVIGGWQQMYESLENYVWKENEKAVEWLRALGFEIHSAKPFGKFREPFHKFTWSQ
jgi:hypothetical protein